MFHESVNCKAELSLDLTSILCYLLIKLKVLTRIVVTMTVLFSRPIVSLGNRSDFVTAILSASFQ